MKSERVMDELDPLQQSLDDLYKTGFKAGLRRAAEICEKRADWIKGRQEGKPEELSNVILRHHAAAHRSASEEILAEADK